MFFPSCLHMAHSLIISMSLFKHSYPILLLGSFILTCSSPYHCEAISHITHYIFSHTSYYPWAHNRRTISQRQNLVLFSCPRTDFIPLPTMVSNIYLTLEKYLPVGLAHDNRALSSDTEHTDLVPLKDLGLLRH